MRLTVYDIAIVVLYLIGMVAVGWFLRKKARQNKESYLMGGKSLPWYMLGLSDASDMFDISGTMWMVTLCFVYGMKSIWIPWLWPVFNQVIMMMFLSKWLRRSNSNTGAEWLATRFGNAGAGVKSSHNIVVAFALLSCFGFLVYGFVGLGKFIEIFVPWEMVKDYVPFAIAPEFVGHFYGIIFTLFAMFYSIIGGMHSIVLGDVIKYCIMTVACISIAVIAMIHLHKDGQTLAVPEGWINPFFGWKLDLEWKNIIPEVNKKINDDGFGLFGIFFMMMLFKGLFASLAGPAPNYDMQKVLSTRSPKEASKMNGFVSIILLPIRYSMVIGLTVLGLLYYNQMNLQGADGAVDFEKIYFFTKTKNYHFEQQFEEYKSKPNHAPRNRKQEGKYKETNQFSDGYRDFYNKGKRTMRSVWDINTKGLKDAHFAVFPEKLLEVPIISSCPENGIVLDIFFGSGTTGVVAKKLNRNWIGIELNPEYAEIAENRLKE